MKDRKGKRECGVSRKGVLLIMLLAAVEIILLWVYWERKMYHIDMEISEFNQQMRRMKK